MNPTPEQVSELKAILEKFQWPEELDDHPWTNCLVLQEELAHDASLRQKSRGRQLALFLSRLFCQIMPSTPPRRDGKRLDTGWCLFGILAAEYFAPFLYNMSYPASMRDAWGRIDMVTPLFVFGSDCDNILETEVERYALFVDAREPTPTSTLSGWHVRGVRRLAGLLVSREQALSQERSQVSPILEPARAIPAPPGLLARGRFHLSDSLKRWGLVALLAFLLGWLSWNGIQAYRIYRVGLLVRDDLRQVQALADGQFDFASFSQAASLIATTSRDLSKLRMLAQPYLWTTTYLAWVPRYGGDLYQAETLLDMSENLASSAEATLNGLAPIAQIASGQQQVDATAFLSLLAQAQPNFSEARAALDRAATARGELDANQLSPALRDLVTGQVDRYLPLWRDGLAFSASLPALMGGTGPRTYLILFQNEDELRPTGGFLTAVATMVVDNGQIISFEVEDSEAVDDLTKPYPPAPWQLRQYMEAQILLLRDSNWSPDFPTSAAMAEYLYAYSRSHSADGVIAVDQHAIQTLLDAFGPVSIGSVPFPISSQNLVSFMRSAKYDTGDQYYDPSKRKDFIGELGQALLAKIESGQGLPLKSLLAAASDALQEKHILVQLDDPAAAALLADLGWDGSLRRGRGDFLMVVDANIGISKSNAVVEEALDYRLDLSDLASPTSRLKIVETNAAVGATPCNYAGRVVRSYEDSINLCYEDYLRVYGSAGIQLLDASPHAVPAEATLDGAEVPARVDMLDENLAGLDGFGTFFVVPVGSSLEMDFRFLLPARVVQTVGSNTYAYELHIQKQPGTDANRLHLCALLPSGATLVEAMPPGQQAGDSWCLDGDLRTDLNVRLEFTTLAAQTSRPVRFATATPFLSSTPGSAMDAPTLASHSEYHGLDTPIGTGIQIIIHQALSGDSLALYASRYGTTVEAIQAVNYQTLSILTPWPPIVIPINAADVSSLPAFDVYQVPDTINVGNLAAQLSVDPALLAASNGLQETDLFMPGEWVLVPR